MRGLLTPFARAETYRRLAFAVSALPLGVVALVLLFAGWGVTVGLAITPLVVPLFIGLRFAVRQLAQVEAFLVRELLGAGVSLPSQAGSGGFWSRLQHAFTDGAFWKQQGYLLLRVVLGWPLAILQLALLTTALWAIALPITYRWQDDADVVGRNIDSLPEALAFVPAGLLVLLVTAHLVRPLSVIWAPIASRLLGSHATAVRTAAETHALRKRALVILAVVVGGLGLLLSVVWALTTPNGYFWPAQAILPLALVLGITAWVMLVLERPEIERKTGGSRALAIELGVFAAIWLYLVAQWLLTERGYFWPAWVLLGLGVAAGIHAAVVFGRREYMRSHRIEQLETTRAGAVDVQETELRRIERDLHDGAQARLVALGMSIGMAEEKLATDPEGARVLLAEARTGAREALEELRDLARGIHPPILTDRGLNPAIQALVARTPLDVDVSVELAERPRPPVETAAYFVVAEALANAGKYSDADHVEIGVHVRDGILVAEVRDDGSGGADPAGKGLTGLRRRVEALDGSLQVSSPAGGPTTVRAELPCGS
ncbi:MAG TPA: sensor domain-containing protein [Gaiella sp.]|nr:sensor domain-containing protein [Gaiella sp.]